MKLFKAVRNNIDKKLHQIRKQNELGLNWFRQKYLKLHRSPDVKTYRLFGKPLSYISEYDLLHSLKELFIEEVYKADLGSNPLIIDCGANIGLSTLYLKRRHADARIIAFEPDRLNFKLLNTNVQAFGLNGVEVRQQAVWKEAAILSFKGGGTLASTIAAAGGDDTYEVSAVKLSDFILEPVALLKIDIEGAEYEVLKEVEPKLSLVSRIFLEYHSTFEDEYKLLELLDMVHRHGFRFYLKEGLNVYETPFEQKPTIHPYDIQLNIFCFRP